MRLPALQRVTVAEVELGARMKYRQVHRDAFTNIRRIEVAEKIPRPQAAKRLLSRWRP
jgi:hypothetical protein